MELREIRVGLVEPEVWPSFPSFHLSCSSACWAVDVVQRIGGEILHLVIFRNLSHTYYCTCLYSEQEKQRWKQKKRDSVGFEHRGV